MRCFAADMATVPPDEHIKTLEDDELLDFWEESQYMEGMLQGCSMVFSAPAGGYERLILQELQLRSCRRSTEKMLLPR